MLRIVGIQRSESVDSEFVLLQNQGAMRLTLKGHAVVTERAFESGECGTRHFFTEEVSLGPGQFVLLHSGHGTPRWSVTRDGAHVYNTFMGSAKLHWPDECGRIHVLATQHTYSERREAFLAV